MTDVVVTGLGVVCSAGRGVPALREALREGRDGLAPLRRFTSARHGQVPVGEVDDRWLTVESPARNVRLGATALLDALSHAGLEGHKGQGTAVIVGSCGGGMPETEQQIAPWLAGEAVDANVWPRHGCDAVATALAERAGARGPVLSVSTACSSGAQALSLGADLLRDGQCERVVAGGVDALCRLTLNGFASLLVVSPEGCRPFDVDRRGMSLGEGAAFVVLETAETARRRDAPALARLAGAGNSCDAYHLTGPHPEGRGAEAALRAALDEAGVAPADIGWVSAHGTGTADNDLAEGAALRRLFGDGMPPLSSIKRCTGHTLGAAGALESIACVLALGEGWLPGNPGLITPDPACGVEPLTQTLDASPRAVLNNAFGFGGNNTVLCFTRVDPS